MVSIALTVHNKLYTPIIYNIYIALHTILSTAWEMCTSLYSYSWQMEQERYTNV